MREKCGGGGATSSTKPVWYFSLNNACGRVRDVDPPPIPADLAPPHALGSSDVMEPRHHCGALQVGESPGPAAFEILVFVYVANAPAGAIADREERRRGVNK